MGSIGVEVWNDSNEIGSVQGPQNTVVLFESGSK